jgi:threonyl-tRNA synthetase
MNSNEIKNLDNLRHSCAHLLAAAVVKLYPKAKPTIGPAIEDGFYYDFDFEKEKVSESDFNKIEKKMNTILKTWKEFTGTEVSVKQAQEQFKTNPYKLELIDNLEKEGKQITIYKSGDFTDLCRGGHIEKPSETLKTSNFSQSQELTGEAMKTILCLHEYMVLVFLQKKA